MDDIKYKVTYGDGDTEFVVVSARSINAGYAKVLRRAKEPLGNGRVREIASIEFWVRDFVTLDADDANDVLEGMSYPVEV